ncbi:MAG: AraC family transcriptional regulator [Oceanospirillaceae bacterium]|nr:AraC family transcriptional regulator [Oceanospirillaceae bacterium]
MTTTGQQIRQDWYEADDKVIAAHHQPALLIDLLRSMDICSHRILRGTGLFLEDVLAGERMISPEQFIQLIRNARKLSNDPGLSFRWGAQLWPGHYGQYSHLLANAANLEEALDILVQYRRYLCPLVSPRIVRDKKHCYVQWVDAVGLGEEYDFVIEAVSAGLASMTRWLADQRLPWRFTFSYAEPSYPEQYQVNLNGQCGFGVGIDTQIIDIAWLRQPWHKGNTIAAQVARRECQRLNETLAADSFPYIVYQHMLDHVREPLSLADMAEIFDMSTATFKRKLRKHNCQFQRLQDRVRFHVCVYLIHVNGWNNEQIAEYLAFSDSNNFRRAFKRWAGFTPSDSRSMAFL